MPTRALLLAALPAFLWGCGPTGPDEGTSEPAITSLSPDSAPAGSADLALIITGANFSEAPRVRSQVVWFGRSGAVPLTTGFVSGTELTAAVPAALLQMPDTAHVYVRTLDPTDNTPLRSKSQARDFRVLMAPVVITGLAPTNAGVGSTSLSLLISGNGFAGALHYRSQAVWLANGTRTPLATTFVGAHQLTAIIPDSLLRAAVTAQVLVETGDPMGDHPLNLSNTPAFHVDVPQPDDTWVLGISPATAPAGSTELTLTITGLNFHAEGHLASEVMWLENGSPVPLPTTFVSSTQLRTRIEAYHLSTPGNAQVFVTVGDRMGDLPLGRSNTIVFSVTPPDPSPDGPVAEIVLSDPPSSIGIGERAVLQAWANGPDIGRISLESAMQWTSPDRAVATVSPTDGDGIPGVDFYATLAGVGPGSVLITAAGGGKTASAVITVGQPATSFTLSPTMATISAARCEAVQLTANLQDAAGNDLPGRKPTWSSSSPSVYVDGRGLAFGVDSGSAKITASTGLISASAVITVVGHQPGWPRRFGCDG